MRKLALLSAGALILTGCGSMAVYTQTDADALENQLRNQKFESVGEAKLDNQKISKRVTKKKIEVSIKVRGCTFEIERRADEKETRLDEWHGPNGSENTITDFPKLNPGPADANKWADEHEKQLSHCYVVPVS